MRDDGELVEMTEQPYGTEDLLQKLLADHPKLMDGDQAYGDEPRRFLLVSREMSLSSDKDGSGRWSVDHLFLDQDAIPTIVEVKRSSNTQIRREVVGQMLDYAANAVVYWPVETLRAQFEATRAVVKTPEPYHGIHSARRTLVCRRHSPLRAPLPSPRSELHESLPRPCARSLLPSRKPLLLG